MTTLAEIKARLEADMEEGNIHQFAALRVHEGLQLVVWLERFCELDKGQKCTVWATQQVDCNCTPCQRRKLIAEVEVR